ncbi:MAG: hypothetical protein V4604_05290 [Bacteroidota bacterium]
MKTILSTLLILLCFSAFAEVDQQGEWHVYYKVDQTMGPTDTKTVIHCYFIGDSDGEKHTEPIVYALDGGSNQVVTLSETNDFTIDLKAGKHTFQFYYNSSFKEIETDSLEVKAGVVTHIDLLFQIQPIEPLIIREVKKPVIYLYPEVPTTISIDLKTIGALTFTYPLLNDGWNVLAQPDGTLTCNGENYPYLFWEADQSVQNPFETETFEGFVVAGKDALAFLEEKLTQIGFNDKERTDFITFWGPQLASNEFNNITFQFNETCDAYGTLHITPKPENVNRVYMIWNKTDSPATDGITPQLLPAFDRSGFDVLEWGGVEVNDFEL